MFFEWWCRHFIDLLKLYISLYKFILVVMKNPAEMCVLIKDLRDAVEPCLGMISRIGAQPKYEISMHWHFDILIFIFKQGYPNFAKIKSFYFCKASAHFFVTVSLEVVRLGKKTFYCVCTAITS